MQRLFPRRFLVPTSLRISLLLGLSSLPAACYAGDGAYAGVSAGDTYYSATESGHTFKVAWQGGSASDNYTSGTSIGYFLDVSWWHGKQSGNGTINFTSTRDPGTQTGNSGTYTVSMNVDAYGEAVQSGTHATSTIDLSGVAGTGGPPSTTGSAHETGSANYPDAYAPPVNTTTLILITTATDYNPTGGNNANAVTAIGSFSISVDGNHR